jgi:hypothetical protein
VTAEAAQTRLTSRARASRASVTIESSGGMKPEMFPGLAKAETTSRRNRRSASDMSALYHVGELPRTEQGEGLPKISGFNSPGREDQQGDGDAYVADGGRWP